MAPLAAEPRQLLVVLNVARRRALYQLVKDITGFMRSQLELSEDNGHDDAGRGQDQSPRGPGGDAPLFAPVSSPRSDDSSSEPAQNRTPPSPELRHLRKAALAHFDAWRTDVLSRLRELVAEPDDSKVLEARARRADRLAQEKADTPQGGESLIDLGLGQEAAPAADAVEDPSAAIQALQALYHPIPTRLTTIPLADRKESLSCLLLLLLASGNYVAHSRVLAVYLASALELPLAVLAAEEKEIAKSLVETAAAAETQMSAEGETAKRKQDGQSGRYWKVGLASVAGAAVIGITGGLAAPVVAGALGGLMGSVGLGGVASFLGIFWMNGALVGTLFGAFGAKMTGEMVDQYAKEVEDFSFLPLRDEWGNDYKRDDGDDKAARRLRVTIGVNGWLTSKEDVTKPWRVLSDDSEVFALRFEMNSLLALGQSLEGLVSSYAWSYVKMEILKRTVLATLWSALWPVHLLRVASNIDNPFNLARNRAEKTGKILADALINKVQGERPVTLVGYSLGARVIYTCLRSLAERKAFGLVESVVFIGAPIPSNPSHFQMMRSVVAGNIFNVYSSNDFILAFMYRATSLQLGVAGLQAISSPPPTGPLPGVENLDLSDDVTGHLRYPDLLPQILTRCGFPAVQGGTGPIEKDSDAEIALRESASAETGSLIELDDLPAEAAPPRRPLAAQQPARSTPSAALSGSGGRQERHAAPARSHSETLMAELDPLGSLSVAESSVRPLGRPARMPKELGRSQPVLPTAARVDALQFAPPVRRPAASSSSSAQSASGSSKVVKPEVAAPVSRPSVPIVSSFDGHSREKDNDEEEDEDDSDEDGGGIKMMDNDDDMVTYDEPLIVED